MLSPIGDIAATAADNLSDRRRRETMRGRQAEGKARAAGADALRVALARLGSEFDETAKIASFKCRILHYIRLGAGHPAVRARFGRRAAMLQGYSLNAACQMVDRWLKQEKQALIVAAAFGRGHTLSLEVLRELRLILRLMRRSEYRRYFQGVIAFVLGEYSEAAE